jgi:uncharacterized membrane protein YphA (DoxX/SURF4 family)
MSTTVKTTSQHYLHVDSFDWDKIRENPALQALWALRLGFTVLPIVFGIDKFAGVLTNWDKYLAPWFNDIIPGTAHQAMYAVGVIEIVAGLAVLLIPRFGAPLVVLWLAGIILNLGLIGGYWDVALRDFGLLLAAACLARLAWAFPDTHRLS